MQTLDKIFTKAPKSKFLLSFQNERTKKFTTIALTLIALSFFGLFAINPTLSTIIRLKKELSDDEFVEQKLKEKINNLSVLSQKYTLLKNDMPFVLDAMPKDPNVPLLLAQVQALANNSNIHIKSLQSLQTELFTGKGGGKQPASYFFSLSGEGTYDTISDFVSSLINLQRIITVESFSLNKNDDQRGLIQFTLKGIAYYKL